MTVLPVRPILLGAAALSAALLTGCFQSPAPTAPAVTPPTAGTPAPSPTTPAPLQSLGLVDVTFSGLTGQDGDLKVTARAPVQAAGLTDRGSIQLQPLSNGTFTTGKRGVDGVRYLYATFLVRNANAAGTAYPTARQNLTLVAASTASTVSGTPFSAIQKYDGSAASPGVAPTILPTAGLTFNRAVEAPTLMPGAEDLQVYAEGEVAPLATGAVTRAFPFGYVVRHRTNTASRTLPANPAAGTFDGVVTVALKLPLQATVADDPFTFNMTFAVVDDSVTRVTESLEEQAAGTVQARATALGAGTQVALLCGSTFAGTNGVFIGSATTAGAAGTDRVAHIGGDVALKALPSAYTATGNVNLTVPVNTGLGQFYAGYPTTSGGAAATPTFTGSGTSRGGAASVSGNGSFTFTSKAGDGNPAVTDTLNYTVSDGRGCTSPTQGAPVNVSGRVWFARNNTANGDGRQGTPFNTLAAARGASATGETLYLYRGDGTTTGQNAGLTLLAGQSLIGEGVALVVNGATVIPAGAQPSALENTAGAGLTLGSGNTVQGVNVKGTTAGISGTGFGTLKLGAGTVQATAGSALTLSSGTLDATSTVTRLDAGAVPAGGAGVSLTGVGGTLTVTGTSAGGVTTPGSGGTLTGPNSAGTNGYLLRPGSASLTLSLTGVSVRQFTSGLLFDTQAADAGTLNLTVKDSAFTDNTAASIQLNPRGIGASRYTIQGNTITHADTGSGVVYQPTARAGLGTTENGFITGNTINLSASGNASGIDVNQYGPGTVRFRIDGNTITSFGLYGITVSSQAAGLGRLDALITNNRISSPAGTALSSGLDGINLLSGTATNGDNNTLCVQLTGNNSAAQTGSQGTAGIAARQRAGTTFLVQGYGGAPTDSAALISRIQNDNVPSTARIRNVSTLSATDGTCVAPQ